MTQIRWTPHGFRARGGRYWFGTVHAVDDTWPWWIENSRSPFGGLVPDTRKKSPLKSGLWDEVGAGEEATLAKTKRAVAAFTKKLRWGRVPTRWIATEWRAETQRGRKRRYLEVTHVGREFWWVVSSDTARCCSVAAGITKTKRAAIRAAERAAR